MKKFLNSIYFYPFIAVVSIFIGLFWFYFYAIDEAQEVIIKQQLQDKTEGALLWAPLITLDTHNITSFFLGEALTWRTSQS